MHRAPAALLALLLVLPAPAAAQTVEERLAQLERQVAELRALHALPAATPAELPEALVGNPHVRWGYPGGACTLLVKEYYVVCHDDPHRLSLWVTYHLTRQDLSGNAARTDDFRADPDLPAGERAELEDYRYSGYDRGHMAPAADFNRNREAMSATFVLSNMAPQRPNLNRRMWAQLEEDIRDLADAHGSIWVFTGPLYLDDAGQRTAPSAFIGPNDVAVPTHFFKAILCEHATGTVELFAFVMENRLDPLAGAPRDYLVRVDDVEELSGLDLFAELPDVDEARLEATVATHWPMN